MSQPPAQSGPSVPSVIGQVVQVRLWEADVLTVIGAVAQAVELGLERRVLGLLLPDAAGWVPDAAVVDWAPRCATCGTARWWWTPTAEVQCASCTPPSPDWTQAWAEVAGWLRQLPPEVWALSVVRETRHALDRAWLTDDWPQFQRHALPLQGLATYLRRIMSVSSHLPSPPPRELDGRSWRWSANA